MKRFINVRCFSRFYPNYKEFWRIERNVLSLFEKAKCNEENDSIYHHAVFARRMVGNPKMLAHLLKVSEHYLFDYFLPVYDEELYLMLTEELLKQPQLSLVQKEQLRYQ